VTVGVEAATRPFDTKVMPPHAASDADDRDDRLASYAERLINDNRREMRRADGKATQALVVAGTGTATLLAAMTEGSWSVASISPGQLWAWWAGCALLVVSVTLLVLALVPRLGGRSPAGRIAYFGDIRRWKESGSLRKALEETAREPLNAALAELSWTSMTVMAKYRLVQYGIITLAAAACLLFASIW